jgi:hypothetical protein
VPGNIDNSIDRKQERSDKRRETITLVGSRSQRENSTGKQRDTDDDKHHGWPPEFSPKPKPVTFRMEGSRADEGSVTKNCKDRFEISKTDPAPGRITNESKRVMKNLRPEIRRDVRTAEIVKMKPIECLPAEKQHRRE